MLTRRFQHTWLPAVLIAAVVAVVWAACLYPDSRAPAAARRMAHRSADANGMVTIRGQREAASGSSGEFQFEVHAVTNRQFRRFVDATGYQTTAESAGYSLVYFSAGAPPHRIAGANWRQPIGLESTIAGREELPVVHVSWRDAAAYAQWSGRKLPSVRQWRTAAANTLSAKAAGGSQFKARTAQTTRISGPSAAGAYPPTSDGVYGLQSPGSVREWCAGKAASGEKPVCGIPWIEERETRASLQTLPATSTDNLTGFRCAR